MVQAILSSFWEEWFVIASMQFLNLFGNDVLHITVG